MMCEKATYKAELEAVSEASALAINVLEKLNVSEQVKNSVLLVIEELLVNIAYYSYPEGNGKVWFECYADENKIGIKIMDSGIPFNPLNYKTMSVEEREETQQIGGLGIYFVRQEMDEVTYEYIDNKNVVEAVLYY